MNSTKIYLSWNCLISTSSNLLSSTHTSDTCGAVFLGASSLLRFLKPLRIGVTSEICFKNVLNFNYLIWESHLPLTCFGISNGITTLRIKYSVCSLNWPEVRHSKVSVVTNSVSVVTSRLLAK